MARKRRLFFKRRRRSGGLAAVLVLVPAAAGLAWLAATVGDDAARPPECNDASVESRVVRELAARREAAPAASDKGPVRILDAWQTNATITDGGATVRPCNARTVLGERQRVIGYRIVQPDESRDYRLILVGY